MAEYKDFILDASVLEEESEKTEATRKKTEVEFETVFVSGPDWAVRRKTKTTSKILACMLSANQFYIKNEKNGEIQKLDEKTLGGFLIHSDHVKIEDEDGNSPFWIKKLYTGKDFREALWYAMSGNEEYKKGLMSGYVLIQGRNHVISVNNLNRLKSSLGDNLLKSYFNSLSEDGKNYFRYLVSTPQYSYGGGAGIAGMQVTHDQNVPENLELKKIRGFMDSLDLSCRYRRGNQQGLGVQNQDNVRYLLERYLASPATTMPNILHIRRHRLHTGETVEWLDERKVIDHCFDSGVEQGYADSLDDFAHCWADYLDQQMLVYGRLVEKYPENLASAEQRLSYVYRQKKELIEAQHFEEAAERMKQYRYADADFIITSPEAPVDMVDESRNMSNCLSSYVKRVGEGQCMIFFLRKADNPNKAYVDIEIREDGSLGQVLSRFNKQPSPAAMDFVREWYKEFFQKEEATSVA